jgi:hypothetical protein
VGPGQTTVGVRWSGHGSLTSQALRVPYIHHRGIFTSTYPLEEAQTVLPSWICLILQAFPVQSQWVSPGQTTVGVRWTGHDSLTSQDLGVPYIYLQGIFTSTYPQEEAQSVLPGWICLIFQAFPVQSQWVGPGQTTLGVGWTGHDSVTSQDLGVPYIYLQGIFTSIYPQEEAQSVLQSLIFFILQ